jgi:hypothetical protein
VEAGVVPVLVGCLASSGYPDDCDIEVHSKAAMGLGLLAATLSLSSPDGFCQLSEQQLSALRPAVPALVADLRAARSSQESPWRC